MERRRDDQVGRTCVQNGRCRLLKRSHQQSQRAMRLVGNLALALWCGFGPSFFGAPVLGPKCIQVGQEGRSLLHKHLLQRCSCLRAPHSVEIAPLVVGVKVVDLVPFGKKNISILPVITQNNNDPIIRMRDPPSSDSDSSDPGTTLAPLPVPVASEVRYAAF